MLTLLATPEDDGADPTLEQPRQNAIWATFLMVAPPGSPEAARAEARLQDVWPRLPNWAQDLTEPYAPACSRESAEPALYCRWPQAFVRGTAPDRQSPGVLVLDDMEPADEGTRHNNWRRWLHLYNTFQTLTGVLLATTEGLQHRDYEHLTPAVTHAAGTTHTNATAQAWASVLNGVLPEVKAGMQTLMTADVPPPDEVGYEHANERGEVDAEAEAAWLSARVVVLTEAQAEFVPFW